MTHAITAWTVITLICAALAIMVVWARRPTRARAVAVLLLVLTLPVTAFLVSVPMGWGVPMVPVLTSPGGDYRLLGAKMIVGKGIFLLLDFGDAEPRHYRLPWDREMADRLQNMFDDPNNEGVKVQIPFEFSWNTKPQFHPMPRPKILPDKLEPEPPVRFNREA